MTNLNWFLARIVAVLLTPLWVAACFGLLLAGWLCGDEGDAWDLCRFLLEKVYLGKM